MTDGQDATGRPAGDAPWLATDELAAWRAFVNLAQRLPAALGEQLQRDDQLSFLEYYVLALLSEEPDRRMRLSRLASTVNSELSRLSHLASRLEKRGLVRREPDPADGRFTLALLTDAGHAAVVRAAPQHVRHVRELFVDAVDAEEMATLVRVADKVAARLDGRR